MADVQMPDGSTQQVPEPTGPMSVVSEVVSSISAGLDAVVNAVHDVTATPLDVAQEHMEHVTELHAEMIDALSHGDVDAASAFNAEAAGELSSAVSHLNDPDAVQAHHAEQHPETAASDAGHFDN